MKHQNDKVSYLKLIFVIPENVIGFIIGINGKNINIFVIYTLKNMAIWVEMNGEIIYMKIY